MVRPIALCIRLKIFMDVLLHVIELDLGADVTPLKLQLIILSACSTPGRDRRPITLPRPIGIG